MTGEQEYWDKEMEDRVTIDEKDGSVVIKDNWVKRKNILAEILKYDFWKKDVLELGCGVATLGAVIKLTCGVNRYRGLDVSPAAVDLSKRAWGLDVKEGKTNSLPFNGPGFDYVIALDVLEHINPEERLDTYKEINRVLNIGGRIMINNPLSESCHNPEYDFSFSEKDLVELCTVTGTIIEDIKLHSAVFSERYYYQFIVLYKPGEVVHE